MNNQMGEKYLFIDLLVSIQFEIYLPSSVELSLEHKIMSS